MLSLACTWAVVNGSGMRERVGSTYGVVATMPLAIEAQLPHALRRGDTAAVLVTVTVAKELRPLIPDAGQRVVFSASSSQSALHASLSNSACVVHRDTGSCAVDLELVIPAGGGDEASSANVTITAEMQRPDSASSPQPGASSPLLPVGGEPRRRLLLQS